MISLIITLAIIGLIVYLIQTIPMAPPFKTLIYVIAVIAVVVYLLKFAGAAGVGVGF